jgi:hypothetical protein
MKTKTIFSIFAAVLLALLTGLAYIGYNLYSKYATIKAEAVWISQLCDLSESKINFNYDKSSIDLQFECKAPADISQWQSNFEQELQARAYLITKEDDTLYCFKQTGVAFWYSFGEKLTFNYSYPYPYANSVCSKE